jgi:hypothetical protein
VRVLDENAFRHEGSRYGGSSSLRGRLGGERRRRSAPVAGARPVGVPAQDEEGGEDRRREEERDE